MHYTIASEVDMIQIPRGIYKHYTESNTYSITFYTETKTYSLSCDSFLGLIDLVNWFYSPRHDMTLVEYNTALVNSLEDTAIININDITRKVA